MWYGGCRVDRGIGRLPGDELLGGVDCGTVVDAEQLAGGTPCWNRLNSISVSEVSEREIWLLHPERGGDDSQQFRDEDPARLDRLELAADVDDSTILVWTPVRSASIEIDNNATISGCWIR